MSLKAWHYCKSETFYFFLIKIDVFFVIKNQYLHTHTRLPGHSVTSNLISKATSKQPVSTKAIKLCVKKQGLSVIIEA